MSREDRRKKRTCIVCKEKITPDVTPWSMVGVTGDTVFWHTTCDKEQTRD